MVVSPPAKRHRRLRVGIVAPSMAMVGGQAIQADRILRQLHDSGSIDALLIPINPVLPGPLGWLQRIRFVRTLVTGVAYVLRLLVTVPGVDVLHVFSASYLSFVLAPTPALLVARLFSKPSILNYHSGEARDHLDRWRRTALPTLGLAETIVVPSKYLVQVFQDFGLDPLVIPNGLFLERVPFRLRSRVRPRFLSNRNLEHHYGVDTVINAFAKVLASEAEARLVVAGSGSCESALRELVGTLGCEGQVTFVGSVSPEEMSRFYDDADVLVNASRIDNMPLTLLEAHAAGLPVVTTNAGGIPFLVVPEETALVVSVDDVDELADAMLRAVRVAGIGERLSVRGRASVETQYAMAQVADQWAKLYGRLARVSRSRG